MRVMRGMTASARLIRRTAIASACLALLPLGARAQTPPRSTPAIEPKAVEALRRMGAYLRTLPRYGVHAETVRDEVATDGQTIQLAGTVQYLVRTPDRFRVDLRTDRKRRQILYDGRSLTVYAPRRHFYATVPAPSTIVATLDTARRRHGIELPLADLFLWGTSRDGLKDVTAARYVGPAYVRGVDTDQYAFRQDGVDWQIWIERGKRPVPRKLVIVTTSLPSRPQFTATMAWDLSPAVGDDAFTFVPPRDASRIVLATLPAAIAGRP
ncbi:MAG: DUF2092 domain-containing protein [Gemmatimonadaceae bacterium]